MLKEWMTYDDVADHFQVKVRTIRSWVSEGIFPKPRALGAGAKRFRRADIEKYQNEVAPLIAGLKGRPHRRKES